MLELTPIPAFTDNYIWAFRNADDNQVCIVDPGTAGPVLEFLQQNSLGLEAIVITHHHADHIGGISELLGRYDVPVFGPDSSRIPQVTVAVHEGSSIELAGRSWQVLEVPGHTMEHIAWFSEGSADGDLPVLFCGDTLFAAGCGRMFEGTAPVMHASLQKLAALPGSTRVCCAHEYTMANLSFARAAMPDNQKLQQRIVRDQSLRDRQQPTLPSTLAVELDTNPFLRCDNQQIREQLARHTGLTVSEDAEVFGQLRQWKDNF